MFNSIYCLFANNSILQLVNSNCQFRFINSGNQILLVQAPTKIICHGGGIVPIYHSMVTITKSATPAIQISLFMMSKGSITTLQVFAVKMMNC